MTCSCLQTRCLALILALLGGLGHSHAQPGQPHAESPPPDRLTLEQCWELALRRNREIQVERLNPSIARHSLSAAHAAYDPILFNDARWESLADTGGLDPADLSRDAIYEAQSEASRLGITGLLPSGLTYSLNTDYAHSDGSRNSLDFDSYSLRLGGTLRQPLLRNSWIDSARLSVRASRLLVRSADLALRYRVLDVIQRATHAFHELGFAHQNHRTQQDLVTLRHAYLETVRRRVEGGTLTSPDLALAAAQVAVAEAQAAAAAQNLALARHELLTLIGHPWRDPGLPACEPVNALQLQPVVLDLHASWQEASARRPDLAMLHAELERSELDVRFWRNQLFPTLDLVGAYGRRGASTTQTLPQFNVTADFDEAWNQVADGTAPNHGVGFIFSMPLTRRLERSRHRASRDTRAQVELRVLQHEEWIRREIADAHSIAVLSRERLALTREARERITAALAAEEQRLAGGKSTVFLVLQLQSDLAQARAAEWRARADHLQAVNRLHFADGSLLERLGIQYEPAPPPADGPR